MLPPLHTEADPQAPSCLGCLRGPAVRSVRRFCAFQITPMNCERSPPPRSNRTAFLVTLNAWIASAPRLPFRPMPSRSLLNLRARPLLLRKAITKLSTPPATCYCRPFRLTAIYTRRFSTPIPGPTRIFCSFVSLSGWPRRWRRDSHCAASFRVQNRLIASAEIQRRIAHSAKRSEDEVPNYVWQKVDSCTRQRHGAFDDGLQRR